MTPHLTRIAIGAVTLFFVCIFTGAVILRGGKTHQESTEAQPSYTPGSTQRDGQAQKDVMDLNDLDFVPGTSQEVDNIEFYGGRVTTDGPTFESDSSDSTIVGDRPLQLGDR